jgi:hypothetical protein
MVVQRYRGSLTDCAMRALFVVQLDDGTSTAPMLSVSSFILGIPGPGGMYGRSSAVVPEIFEHLVLN